MRAERGARSGRTGAAGFAERAGDFAIGTAVGFAFGFAFGVVLGVAAGAAAVVEVAAGAAARRRPATGTGVRPLLVVAPAFGAFLAVEADALVRGFAARAVGWEAPAIERDGVRGIEAG